MCKYKVKSRKRIESGTQETNLNENPGIKLKEKHRKQIEKTEAVIKLVEKRSKETERNTQEGNWKKTQEANWMKTLEGNWKKNEGSKFKKNTVIKLEENAVSKLEKKRWTQIERKTQEINWKKCKKQTE